MDLIASVMLTAILLPLANISAVGFLQILVGLPVVLVVPGWALLAALFPRRTDLDGPQRVALSLVLSLAVVMLLALALHFTPWGIQQNIILLILGFWNIGLSVMAWYLRRRFMPEQRFDFPLGSALTLVRGRRSKLDIVAAGFLALAILGIVSVVGWRINTGTPGQAFTEFYILDDAGKIEDYAVNLTLEAPREYRVGVTNHEKQITRYSVRAFLDNSQIDSIDSFSLQNNETWDGTITLVPEKIIGEQKLELHLYKDTDLKAYRTLHLYLDIRSP
jgi:uncharacterized membrane protein